MTLEEQINLYNQVHENKFYIIRQHPGYSDLLLHPDLENSITIGKYTDLEIIIKLMDICKNLSSEDQTHAKVTSNSILIRKVQADSQTWTELTLASNGHVNIYHTRYQKLRRFTVMLKTGIKMTHDSSRPVAIKFQCHKQCQKEDVSEVLAQLEKETQLQADNIHYGTY